MIPTVLSLFAGIGGLDLGLERVGCKTLWYSEVDPYACRIMERHFPDAENLGDITAIDWTTTDARPDIICGGFPCQDISLAGRGEGIKEGTRSGLWSCYADAVRILRPRIVIVENVAALLHRGLGRVLGDLAACGYDAEWDCISASAVGAPHRRDRLFIVAYTSGIRRDRWPESSASRREAWNEHDHGGVSSMVNPDGTHPQGGCVPVRMGSKHADSGDGGFAVGGTWPRPLRSDAWNDAEPAGGGQGCSTRTSSNGSWGSRSGGPPAMPRKRSSSAGCGACSADRDG